MRSLILATIALVCLGVGPLAQAQSLCAGLSGHARIKCIKNKGTANNKKPLESCDKESDLITCPDGKYLKEEPGFFTKFINYFGDSEADEDQSGTEEARHSLKGCEKKKETIACADGSYIKQEPGYFSSYEAAFQGKASFGGDRSSGKAAGDGQADGDSSSSGGSRAQEN